MRIVVATLPDVAFGLGRDLVLAKSGAVFGDETLLISPTYGGTEPMLDFMERPVLHQLDWLAALVRDPGFVQGQRLTDEERRRRIREAEERSEEILRMAARWREIVRPGGTASVEEERDIRRIRDHIGPLAMAVAKTWSDDRDSVRRAKELRRASALGLLKVERLGEAPSIYFTRSELTRKVETALCEPGTYGAMDERLLPLIRPLSEGQRRKQRVIAVGGEMFRRMPDFGEVSFDEIADIRKELAPYLPNFRRAVSELADEIRAESWDADFPHEVERELLARLMPEVAAIEDKVSSNSFLGELLHKVAKEPLVLPATSALGMILTTTAQVPAVVAQVVGAAAGLGLLAYEAREGWKESKAEAEENLFFFYYKVRKMVGTRKKRRTRKGRGAT